MTKTKSRDDNAVPITADLEASVGVGLDTLTALFVLEGIKGFGPQKAKEVHGAGLTARQVVNDPQLLPIRGDRGRGFREALAQLSDADRQSAEERARTQIRAAAKWGGRILTYDSPTYPQIVFRSNNPIPVLFCRGDLSVLGHTQQGVACVGSRDIRKPYADLHRSFAALGGEQGFTVASGFATGADRIGHEVARDLGTPTICVMPCGLDRPFPPENRDLWDHFIGGTGGLFVSEFGYGIGASALTLRKRNKLIVAFGLGVLISQSSAEGGAMNAYRFAREQRKPVATFESDGQKDTSGNRLIAEERRDGDRVFVLGASRGEQTEWLNGLSSST